MWIRTIRRASFGPLHISMARFRPSKRAFDRGSEQGLREEDSFVPRAFSCSSSLVPKRSLKDEGNATF